MLEPAQLQHRPAEPKPLLDREAVPTTAASLRTTASRRTTLGPEGTAGSRTTGGAEGAAGPRTTGGSEGAGGSRERAGAALVDPVAEGCRQQPAEARDVLHRHPEGPDAAVVLPDAQHDEVPLRMPGDAQAGPALVEEHIPAGRQCSRVLHRSRVAALEPRFKAPGSPAALSPKIGSDGSIAPGRGLFHILGGVVLFAFPGG
jgi:hypothetical protein